MTALSEGQEERGKGNCSTGSCCFFPPGAGGSCLLPGPVQRSSIRCAGGDLVQVTHMLQLWQQNPFTMETFPNIRFQDTHSRAQMSFKKQLLTPVTLLE